MTYKSNILNISNYRIIYNMDGILQREINKQPKNEKWNQNAKVGDRVIRLITTTVT